MPFSRIIFEVPCLALGQSAGCLALGAAWNYYRAHALVRKHGIQGTDQPAVSLGVHPVAK